MPSNKKSYLLLEHGINAAMSKLSGVYVVMTTPFHKDGALDYEGVQENIEYFIGSGVRGRIPGILKAAVSAHHASP